MYEVVLSKTTERRGHLRAETLLRVRVDAPTLNRIRDHLSDFTTEFVSFLGADGIAFTVRRALIDSLSAVPLT